MGKVGPWPVVFGQGMDFISGQFIAEYFHFMMTFTCLLNPESYGSRVTNVQVVRYPSLNRCFRHS